MTRRWRNWYTRMLEVHVAARLWRFKSSPAHKMIQSTPGVDDIVARASGVLFFRGAEYRCALGKNGVAEEKVDGDGKTPNGCFPIRKIFYRKDKLGAHSFSFPTREITRYDAWCDNPNDSRYNTHITVDENATELLWRNDDLYDVVVVLGYNDNPPLPGKGSAIFMHVAREGYTPTAGCIVLALPDLFEVLRGVSPDTHVCVTE